MCQNDQAQPQNESSTRRGFCRFLGQALLALLVLPARRVWAKKIGLDLRRAAELKQPGGTKLIDYRGTQILLVRDQKGGVHAINNTCTHKKCKVAYRAAADNLFCKCHRSAFELSGKVVAGPAPRPLTTYPAHIKNDKLIVEVPL